LIQHSVTSNKATLLSDAEEEFTADKHMSKYSKYTDVGHEHRPKIAVPRLELQGMYAAV